MKESIVHAQAGIILVTTVMIILLLTLLVLTSLKSVLLYMKASNQIMEVHQEHQAVERVALRLALRAYNEHPDTCVLNEVDPNDMLGLLDNIGCALQEGQQTYHYLIDDLGLSPCLPIDVGGTLYSSHHWLMSIVTTGKRQVYVQIRMAIADKALPCASYDQRVIRSGILSWRQFVSGQSPQLPLLNRVPSL